MKKKPSQDALMEALQEFLVQSGYVHTAEALVAEAKKAKPKPPEKDQTGILFKAFEAGAKDPFFKHWQRLVGSRGSPEAVRLEFLLHVYFGIYPLHPAKKTGRVEDKDRAEFRVRMEDFKQYLDNKGAMLSKTEEYLHFYALPYVPNPSDHPSFKVLFTRNWFTEIKTRLQRYFQSNKPQAATPVLVQAFNSFNSQGSKRGAREEISDDLREEYERLTQEVASLQAEYSSLSQKEEFARNTLIESQSKWTNFSKDILNMSKELLRALEQMRSGRSPNDQMLSIVQEKMTRYEQFLNMSSDELSGAVSISQGDRSMSDFTPSPQPKQLQSDSVSIQLDKNMVRGHTSLQNLHFATVIRDLSSLQDEHQLCLLLQALRWRLTRSQSLLKREMLSAYVKFNILCTSKPHDQLLDRLFSSTKRIKDYTVRFLNVIASECAGRTYLLTKENIVASLAGILFEEREDSMLRQNALGSLQKLSLRRQAQSEMIEQEMLEWLSKLLKSDADAISYYTLEYATALLMNLSLRTAGKAKIESSSIDLIRVLHGLIEHENTQVRTYVNGTLYSILTRQKLKERAYSIGLDQALKELMRTTDMHFKRQIQYILDQLENEQDDALSDDNEDDAEDRDYEQSEIDDLIGEDEDMDDVIKEANGVDGEEFLSMRYLNKPHEYKRPVAADKPLSRPTTPAQPQVAPASAQAPIPSDRSIPSELRSRPKIPRTPAGPELGALIIPKHDTDQSGSQAEEELKPGEGTGEFSHAFKSRNRILRSPE
jgi:ketosteroid isomerase-like protein